MKETIKASNTMITPKSAPAFFEALRDRKFTMGWDAQVHLTPTIVEGLCGINKQSPDKISKLTGMGPDAWKVFLWALYVRSHLEFRENKDQASLPDNALGMERYRRNAIALMMIFFPVIADGCKRSLVAMPVLPMPLVGLSPMQKQALIDKKKTKPEDLNQINYTIRWEPLLPMEYRMLRLNLPIGDAKGNTPSVAGSDDILKVLKEKMGLVNNLSLLVHQALMAMETSRTMPEERLVAAGVLEQCAPVSMLSQVVDMALAEKNDMVLMKLLECVISMLDSQSPPSDQMFEEYGRLVHLAESVTVDKVRNYLRAMAHFIEHPNSQEIFFELLKSGGPKMRMLVIEDLAKYPDKRTAQALLEIAEKDQEVAKQARKEAQRIYQGLNSHELVDLLAYEDNANRTKIIDCLAEHRDDDAVSALAEMAQNYADKNLRARALAAVASMGAKLDIGHLSTITRISLLALRGLPGAFYQRLAQAPWEFSSDTDHHHTDFDFFVRSIPSITRESERLHLLDVVVRDLKGFIDYPGVANHARWLAALLSRDFPRVYQEPLEKIFALLPDVTNREEDFASRVEILMGKSNAQVTTADLQGLLGVAYELVSPLAPAKAQARLALLLRRLAAEADRRQELLAPWEVLLRFALVERFGVDEKTAREALIQNKIIPATWIVERLGNMDDGDPLPQGFTYNSLSDMLVKDGNASIFMERVAGTMRFRAPYSGGLPAMSQEEKMRAMDVLQEAA